jgi:hypothetical protein
MPNSGVNRLNRSHLHLHGAFVVYRSIVVHATHNRDNHKHRANLKLKDRVTVFASSSVR